MIFLRFDIPRCIRKMRKGNFMTNSPKNVHFLPELEAANSIFRMNADDMARKRCRDREEHYREIRGLRKQIEEQAAEIKKMGTELEEKDAEIAHLRKQLENGNE